MRVIREPPILFSTEREEIEALVIVPASRFSGPATLCVKRTCSVRFVPLVNGSDQICDDNSEAIDLRGSPGFPILGSDSCGGENFNEFQSDVSLGFFATNLPNTGEDRNDRTGRHPSSVGLPNYTKDGAVDDTSSSPPVSTLVSVIRRNVKLTNRSSSLEQTSFAPWVVGRFDWSPTLSAVDTKRPLRLSESDGGVGHRADGFGMESSFASRSESSNPPVSGCRRDHPVENNLNVKTKSSREKRRKPPEPDSNNPSPESAEPASVLVQSYKSHAYRLRQRYKATDVACLCPLYSYASSSSSPCGDVSMFASVHQSVQHQQPSSSSCPTTPIELHIVSTSSFSCLSQLILPPLPKSFASGSVAVHWRILQLQHSVHPVAVLVYGTQGREKHTTALLMGIATLPTSESGKIKFYGWEIMPSPTQSHVTAWDSRGTIPKQKRKEDCSSDQPHGSADAFIPSCGNLLSVHSLPRTAPTSRHPIQPNVMLVWSNGIYQLLTVTTTCCSVMRTFSVIALHSPLWILPVSASLVLEGNWDSTEDILWTRIRHLPSGCVFSLTSTESSTSSSSSEVKLDTIVGIDLPYQPKDVQAIHVVSSTPGRWEGQHQQSAPSMVMMIRNRKQIYWRWFDCLSIATTASMFVASKQSYEIPTPIATLSSSLKVSEMKLRTAGIDPKSNSRLLQLLHCLVFRQQFPPDVVKDIHEFESSVRLLFQRNLISLSKSLMDVLLKLNLEEFCCECLTASPLVPESLIADLLSRFPSTFLGRIVNGVSASRTNLVCALKAQLNMDTIKIILEHLNDWCAIRTSLPEALLEKEGHQVPSLFSVSEFLSVLVDAKFSEFIRTDNVVVVQLIQTIADHIALSLGSRRNYQKVHGQLFSVLESRQSELKKLKAPIEFVELYI